jgi:hypothetical protein
MSSSREDLRASGHALLYLASAKVPCCQARKFLYPFLTVLSASLSDQVYFDQYPSLVLVYDVQDLIDLLVRFTVLVV